MDDPLAVGMLDRAGETRNHLACEPGCRGLSGQLPIHTPAIHKFLNDERSARVGSCAEDLNDIGVLEPGEGRGLNQKSRALRHRASQLRFEKLEGHPPPEVDLLRQVDHPHAPAAAFAQNHESRYLGKCFFTLASPGLRLDEMEPRCRFLIFARNR